MKLNPSRLWKVGLSMAIVLFLYYLYCQHYNTMMNTKSSILMVVTEWNPHREKLFVRCLKSLSSNTQTSIELHLVVDHKSLSEVSRIVTLMGWWKSIKFTTYLIEDIYKTHLDTIIGLQKFFSVPSVPYYRKALFYLIPLVHKIIKDDKVILLDTDTVVIGDINELYREFDAFYSSQIWGVVYEQNPRYALALRNFRQSNKNTVFGGYAANGGIPGINTGVLLVDIKKLNDDSFVQDNYLTEKYYTYLVNRFQVQGKMVLGDQDFLTLLHFEHPELFCVIDCGWNRQLCMKLKKKFPKQFDLYNKCTKDIKILHGNCNTTIPKYIKE